MKEILLACALALSACAEQHPLATPESDADGRSFAAPAPGQAALYIYRTRAGNAGVVTIGSRMLGQLQGGYWMRTDLPPGRYDVRCMLPAWSTTGSILLDLAPNEVAYIKATERISLTCELDKESPAVAQPAILAGKRVRELN